MAKRFKQSALDAVLHLEDAAVWKRTEDEDENEESTAASSGKRFKQSALDAIETGTTATAQNSGRSRGEFTIGGGGSFGARREYDSLRNAEDFASVSKTMRESAPAAVINPLSGNLKARSLVQSIQMDDMSRVADQWSYMTPEQQDNLLYLAGKEDWDKATEYLDYIESGLNAQSAAAQKERLTAMAEDHPVLSSVLSVPTSLAGGAIGAADLAAQNAKRLFTGEDVDYNSEGQRIGQMAEQLRTPISEDLDEKYPNVNVLGLGAGDLYNTGLSMGESLAAAAVPGGAFVLAANAAQSGVRDAAERGADDNQALLTGLAWGAAEWAFERWSIGNFKALKEVPVSGWKDVLGNIAKSVGVNFSEELLTEAANVVTDTMINGDVSNLVLTANAYMANGMSESDAVKQTLKDTLGQVLKAGVSGGLMGFAFGGVGTGISAMSNRGYVQQTDTLPETIEQAAAEAVQRGQAFSGTETLEDTTQQATDRAVSSVSAQLNTTDTQTAKTAGNRTQSIKDATGYGDYGVTAFTALMDSTEDVSFDALKSSFQTAYEAGLTDMPTAKANLATDIQRIAFNAGKQDYIMSSTKAAEVSGYATVYGEESGFIQTDAAQGVSRGTIDTLNTVAKALGIKAQFADQVLGGKSNGSMSEDGILTIARDAQDPYFVVAKHEITHRIQELAPTQYSAYRNYAVQYLAQERGNTSSTLVEAYQDRAADSGITLTAEGAMDEIAADFTELILTDETALREFAQEMSQTEEQRTVAQKFFDAVRDFIEKVKTAFKGDKAKMDAAAQEQFGATIEQLEKAEQLWKEAFTAAKQNAAEMATEKQTQKNTAKDGGVKYSLNADFDRQFDAWLASGKQKAPGSGRFHVGATSEVLQSIGVEDYDIYWNAGKIAKIMSEHTSMTADVIKSVPEVLEHPILVMQSQTVTNRITMFGEAMDADGKPVLVAVELSPQNKSGEIQDFAVIASAYGKNNAQNLIDTSDVLYVEPDKKRTNNWLKLLRLQLPSRITSYGSISMVTYVNKDVNGKITFGETGGKTAMQAAFEKAEARKAGDAEDGTKFSLKKPVEETKTLIALHNLTADKMKKVLALGGFPMPSIAVTRTDIPHTNFGDITLVMNKSTIDPQANRKNTVYSADAWTPTVPPVEYEANEKTKGRISKKYYELARRVGYDTVRPLYEYATSPEDALNRNGGETGVLERLRDDTDMMNVFLADTAQRVEGVRKETVTRLDDSTVDLYDALIGKLGRDIWAEMTPRGGESPMTARKRWMEQHGEELKQAYRDTFRELYGMNEEEPGNLEQGNGFFGERSVQGAAVKLRDYLKNGPEKRTTEYDRAATQKVIRESTDQNAYEEWLHGLFDGLEGGSGVYNNKELYTPSGNRRSFRQTHYPVTLENIVKAMAGQGDGNSKNVSGFYGIKSLRAGTAKRIKSIADMHKLEGRLQHLTEEQAEAITDALSNRLTDIMDRVAKKMPGSSNDFMRLDSIGHILMEIADGGTYTVDSITKAFAAYRYNIGNQLATDIRDLLFDTRQMPVNIFEAKPERVVGLDEVLAAVLPDTADTDLRNQLEQAGVSVLTYKADDDASRIEAVNSVDGAQFSLKGQSELLKQYIEKYGAIPEGEKPFREIKVPQKTADDKNVSRTVRTVLEAKATPDEALPTIEKMVAAGEFSYDVYTDKAAIADADDAIKHSGWAQSLSDWMESVKKGEVSKRNTAMGWALYNNAVNSGDIETAMTVLNMMVEHQRNAAQALQATRILKKLSPKTQLYQVQRSVESLQEELNKRYGEKHKTELKVDEELAKEFMEADTQEKRDEILKDIYRDIGRQIPSRFIDKWNAWRYLSMLGNFRTHVRNIVGNAGFVPVVAAKNMTGTAIESVVSRVSGGKLQRSKGTGALATKSGRALVKAAWSDFENVQDVALSGGKYSDFANANQYIEEGRRIFKFAPLEAARKGNSKLLDVEDTWFSRPHYAYAMAQYCLANNITAEQLAKGKAIEPARRYAINEAQKATYRDANAFSQMVSGWGRNTDTTNPAKKAFNVAVEGILPFRKTPANILARGVEYSPIGLMKSLTSDLIQVRNGKMTGAEAIDHISAGLTGTGLVALGVLLASMGLIRGHGGDDEDEIEMEELMGHQAYALELPGGKSVTLDWLAPEALPFFVGVNLWEQGGSENVTLSDILTAVGTVTEPLLEMSCLQSLNDVFDSVGYASSNDLDALPSALASAATSYITQGIPTLLGQAERSGQEERVSTYTAKDAFLTSDMQYTLGSVSAKLPGWDFNQIPYIDAWGRKETTGSTLERIGNNFLNPAYTSDIETSAMEEELLRLYEATGESSVFPSRADKYFTVDKERKDLTAEEYVKYATVKGQTAYDLITNLTESKAYKALSDAEKVKAISEVYSIVNEKGKAAVSNYKPTTNTEEVDTSSYAAYKALRYTANTDGKVAQGEVIQILEDMLDDGLTDEDAWSLYIDEYTPTAATGFNKDGTRNVYGVRDAGVDIETWLEFKDGMNNLEYESGVNGARQDAIIKLLESMNLDDATYDILYGTEYKPSSSTSSSGFGSSFGGKFGA